MTVQLPLSADALAPDTQDAADTREIAPDLAYRRLKIVNVVFFGLPGKAVDWILVDAGLPGSEKDIVACAEARFGKDSPPACIVLTHGHFDHVGAVEALAERWDVGV